MVPQVAGQPIPAWLPKIRLGTELNRIDLTGLCMCALVEPVYMQATDSICSLDELDKTTYKMGALRKHHRLLHCCPMKPPALAETFDADASCPTTRRGPQTVYRYPDIAGLSGL